MASSLRQLAEAANQRRRAKELLDEATQAVRARALEAEDAGNTTRRVSEVGEISPDTLNRWKTEAKKAKEAQKTEGKQGPNP
ncbi:hypothetical protein DMB42_52065 [Nonomuraea sp. WAC 01424]|uniref:hypothetical protein n=1 Tax=Nonomuraea sp. WAC 01424 TaxID=2203200 RepID=UPI000F79121F|nr:hypothetical protein [Nonomuraea sp. WAC 01424]RSM93769.1 hypothetical protein DMB42_52065 [Nonomuraea sp. WAC 01424]